MCDNQIPDVLKEWGVGEGASKIHQNHKMETQNVPNFRMSWICQAKAAWRMEFEADAVAAQSECRFLQARKREVASTVAHATPC